jgi:tRNA threonylcarbamoyladenosine biosynthesis protein TsaE
VTVDSHSPEQTQAIAAEFARNLSPGACIALSGELGAGKTQFVRGLVRGLGGNPRAVSSPTYILLNMYDTPRFPVFHLDAYRVFGPADFESIGFAELLDQSGLVVVEWPQRIQSLIPPSAIHIHIDHTSTTSRLILISHSSSSG